MNKIVVTTVRTILEATDPYISQGIQNPEIPTNNVPTTPEPLPSNDELTKVADSVDDMVRGPEDQILSSINKIINLKNKILDSKSDGEINKLISSQNMDTNLQ